MSYFTDTITNICNYNYKMTRPALAFSANQYRCPLLTEDISKLQKKVHSLEANASPLAGHFFAAKCRR